MTPPPPGRLAPAGTARRALEAQLARARDALSAPGLSPRQRAALEQRCQVLCAALGAQARIRGFRVAVLLA